MSIHWHLERDSENRAWLHFDHDQRSANVLTEAALDELSTLLDVLYQDLPASLILLSDKASGFIAGADINGFVGRTDKQATKHMIQGVHRLFQRLDDLPCPTLALIHGFCLGGGLELSLACDYRIALDDPNTRIGLPEVQLGIFPGFGGTWRSLRLLGPIKAMSFMLAGRPVDARRAKRMGLINATAPKRLWKDTARHWVDHTPSKHEPHVWEQALNHAILRPALGWYLRRQVAQKVRPDHYPAPYKLIEHWQNHGIDPQGLLASEAQSVAELLTDDRSLNLIRCFQLSDQLKALGKKQEQYITHVHVIGAGVMGGDIAAWCALKGYQVTLEDINLDVIGRARARAFKLFKKKLKQTPFINAAMDRLRPDPNGHGRRHAQVLVEAVFEDPKIKQALYAELEDSIPADCLIATNTSSIPLAELAEAMQQPERLVGLHFFNPVAQMQLVEVVVDEQTAEEVQTRATAFAKAIGKLPLPVRSRPGFLVNRILMPYLMESIHLLDDGYAAEDIDAAALEFGMPMGPIALADTVGLDICLNVADMLSNNTQVEAVPERLRQKVKRGHLGKKSGQGFYRYPNKNKRVSKPVNPVVQDRLMYRLFNEAMACWDEGIVSDTDLLDAGIIFGTGFAPFRGGPMLYLQALGWDKARDKLEHLHQHYGERFAIHPGWDRSPENQ